MKKIVLFIAALVVLTSCTDTSNVGQATQISPYLFLNPPNEFRIHPINHDLGAAKFSNQMEAQINNRLTLTGAGGTVTNIAWTEEWIEDPVNITNLIAAARAIKGAGYRTWLYDEYWYPSGWAKGLSVRNAPENEARIIAMLVKDGSGSQQVSFDLPQEGFAFEYAAFYPLVNGAPDFAKPHPVPVGEKNISASGIDGTWRCFAFYIRRPVMSVFETTGNPPGDLPRTYLNFLNRDAVARYIDVALEPIAKAMPDFGAVFDAIFTDEPSLMSMYMRNNAGLTSFVGVPWGNTLFDTFMEMHGYDLHPFLPCLFAGSDEKSRTVRVQYYRTVARLMADNFTGQVAAWCAKEGVRYSGHLLLEESIFYHVGYYADFMKVIGNFGWPGFDMLTGSADVLWNSSSHLAGKYAASASRLAGHNTTMLEICPVAQTDEFNQHPFESFMALTTHLYFLGATHMNAYGYYFIKDNAQLRLWNEYTGRLAYMLRPSRSDPRIAVYYPIADAQASLIHSDDTMKEIAQDELHLDDAVKSLTIALYEHGLDFNFITEDAVCTASPAMGTLTAGGIPYRVIILPHMRVIALAALERLAAFAKQGGLVVFLGCIPTMGVAENEHEKVRALAAGMASEGAFIDTSGGNLALNAAVTASSTDESVYKAEYITDGIRATDGWNGWSTNQLPAEVVIDLGEPRRFNRIEFYTKKSYEQMEYKLYCAEGDGWKLLAEVDGNTEDHRTHGFEPVESRKISIVMTKGNVKQASIARITEVEVYSAEASGTEDRLEELWRDCRKIIDETMTVTGATGIYSSRYLRGNSTLRYIVNTKPDDAKITIADTAMKAAVVYDPETGVIENRTLPFTMTLKGHRGVLLGEP